METPVDAETPGGRTGSGAPRVTITHGPGAGESFFLRDAEVVIGRGAAGTDGLVALADPTVSRAHARLVQRDGGFVLEDLGSANGTALNYARVGEPRVLRDGDLIKVGATVLVFRTVAVTPPTPAARGDSQVVTLFSLKGGVGRTTLAVNLALRLRALTQAPVLLIDLSLEQAAVASHLNLTVRRGIDDLASLDMAAHEGLRWVLAHHASGLHVLPAPPSPEHAERVEGDFVARLLPTLKANYQWIVVDTAPTFSDLNLSVFEQSDWLLHVAMADVAALRTTQASLGVISRLPELPCAHRVVLNGVHARPSLDRAAIERTLGRHFDLVVPHSETVLDSLDRGQPLAVSAPADPLVQALDGWVERVAGVQAPQPARAGRGFWPRLKVSAVVPQPQVAI